MKTTWNLLLSHSAQNDEWLIDNEPLINSGDNESLSVADKHQRKKLIRGRSKLVKVASCLEQQLQGGPSGGRQGPMSRSPAALARNDAVGGTS